MIGVSVQIDDRTRAVTAAAERAKFRNLGHAAATLRKEAAASIEVDAEPSAPGTPPHTRRRQLKRAIRYDVDRSAGVAVIGPEASKVGESASAHEHGGDFKGEEYPARPFMFPALEANLDRLAGEWQGAIGE